MVFPEHTYKTSKKITRSTKKSMLKEREDFWFESAKRKRMNGAIDVIVAEDGTAVVDGRRI